MGHDILLDRKVYAQGDIIFKQGSTGRTAYIVQKGSVDIVRDLEKEGEVMLGTVGVGAIFGEMSVIDDSPRMATARAAEDATTVIVITEQMFLNKLSKADPFIRGLMNIMVDTIRNMGKKAH